jgi:hypothetical protein
MPYHFAIITSRKQSSAVRDASPRKSSCFAQVICISHGLYKPYKISPRASSTTRFAYEAPTSSSVLFFRPYVKPTQPSRQASPIHHHQQAQGSAHQCRQADRFLKLSHNRRLWALGKAERNEALHMEEAVTAASQASR